MKTVSILTLTLLLGSCARNLEFDISGEWSSEDYTCEPQEKYAETFEVSEKNGQLICTKIKGDPCVGEGEVTWKSKGDLTNPFYVDVFFARPDDSETQYTTGKVTVSTESKMYLEVSGETYLYKRM